MAQAGLVRIGKQSHRTLRQLAEWMGESMQAVAEKAIEELRRQQMFAEADASFVELKKDANGWAEELAERDVWANTLRDGLDDETWTADGRIVSG